MVGPRACRSPHQNTPSAKENEPAGAVPTESSGFLTSISVMSRAQTLVPSIALAACLAFAAVNLADRYSDKDFQGIFKTILKIRAPAPQPESLCKRRLKARALDIYRYNIHMEHYNFCRQCEDHFATADATKPNRMLFAPTFLKNQALFRW